MRCGCGVLITKRRIHIDAVNCINAVSHRLVTMVTTVSEVVEIALGLVTTALGLVAIAWGLVATNCVAYNSVAVL